MLSSLGQMKLLRNSLLVSSVFLLACSSGEESRSPELLGANPTGENGGLSVQLLQSTSEAEFTAEVFSDGKIVVKWPIDQLATGYSVYRDGVFIARLPSHIRQYTDSDHRVTGHAGNLNPFARNSSQVVNYKINSVLQDSREQLWVDSLQVPLYMVESQAVVTVDVEGLNNIPPVPVPTTTPTTTPEPEPTPTPEPTPEPTIDLAPVILSISLGCDPVTESVVVNIGETANFSIILTDEMPSTITYSATSNDEELLLVSVDDNGTVLLQGIAEGLTNISIVVTDENGLQDALVLNVMVE